MEESGRQMKLLEQTAYSKLSLFEASSYDLTIRSWPRAFGSEISPVPDRGRLRVEQVIFLLYPVSMC